MGWLVFFLAVAIVAWWLFRSNGANAPAPQEPGPRLSPDSGWLKRRWAQAERERAEGELKSVPKWFFDEATDRQVEYLRKLGEKVRKGKYTKGQISDLIGIYHPPDEEDKKVLKFFKIPLKGLTQTRARYEVTLLLEDAANLEAWENRPALPLQKEFFRFFGLAMPKRLTKKDADRIIGEHKGSGDLKERLDEWGNYKSMYEEIIDPENREDYQIKKASLSQYRKAIETIRADGAKLEDLGFEDVIEKLTDLNPNLEKE